MVVALSATGLNERSAGKILISVVIPVWNGEGTIGACLAGLRAQSFPHAQTEVIVVDNGSTDRTREIVASFENVRLLSEEKPGSYNARNAGIRAAIGEYVALLDADCVPHCGWLAAGVKAATSDPDFGVLAGDVELKPEKPADLTLFDHYEMLFAFRQEDNLRAGVVATVNWLSQTARLLEFDGFNASLKSGADGELSRRIRDAGHKLVFVPDMKVSHPVRGSLEELIKKRRRFLGGRWDRTGGVARSLKVAGLIGVDTLRKWKRVLKAKHLPLTLRLQLCLLVVRLNKAALAEWIKLIRGGSSNRA